MLNSLISRNISIYSFSFQYRQIHNTQIMKVCTFTHLIFILYNIPAICHDYLIIFNHASTDMHIKKHVVRFI